MATTNFFAQVAAIPFEGCLNITIKKDGEQQTVSLLLQNEACGDTAKNHIPPLILKGNVKELGEGFFPAIAEPVQQASALLLNMEQFLKGQENAKKHCAMEKKKTEKPTVAAEPKAGKYDNAMAKVDALEAAGNFREAWMKVPQPNEFPEKAEELRSRRASLSAKFSPDLFGAAQPNEPINEVEPNTKEDATDHTDAQGIPDEGEGQ